MESSSAYHHMHAQGYSVAVVHILLFTGAFMAAITTKLFDLKLHLTPTMDEVVEPVSMEKGAIQFNSSVAIGFHDMKRRKDLEIVDAATIDRNFGSNVTAYVAQCLSAMPVGDLVIWLLAVILLVLCFSMPRRFETAGRQIEHVICDFGATYLEAGSDPSSCMTSFLWADFFHCLPKISICATVMMILCMVLQIVRNAGVWKSHVLNKTHVSTATADFSEMIMSAILMCRKFSSPPVPYILYSFKISLSSFLMDLFMGSEDLKSTQHVPLGVMATIFVAYQFATYILAVGRSVSLALKDSDTVSDLYGHFVFILPHQSAFCDLVLMMVKMFAEQNLLCGVPLVGYEFWLHRRRVRLPRVKGCVCSKATVFWTAAVMFLTTAGPIFMSHALPPVATYGVVGFLFPIWGTVAFTLRCCLFFMYLPKLNSVIAIGAATCTAVWGYVGILIAILIVATYFRTALWHVQNRAYGKQVNGQYGWAKSVTTICLTVLLLFLWQTVPVWGIWIYSQKAIQEAPFKEFNSRQMEAYKSCIFTNMMPKIDQLLFWLGIA